jgi:uncharacterized membrane protein
MNAVTLKRIVVLGSLTGMRSMAGLTVLTLPCPGVARSVMALAAAGEMIADKTSLVGDRVDTLPLAGRAIIGALVGALIAREEDQNALLGGMLGSAAALVAAHLAYRGRKRLPISGFAGGLLEDGLVLAIGLRFA